MAKTAFGDISGVPWSTTAESSYTVIMENVEMKWDEEPMTLEDEDDNTRLHVQTKKKCEITFDATVKGATHFGTDALVGSVITSMDDNDIPVPFIITSNGLSKTRKEWQKSPMTGVYYEDDFTTGTLISESGGFTTTTTAS